MSDIGDSAMEGAAMGCGAVIGRSLKMLLICALLFGVYKFAAYKIEERRVAHLAVAVKTMTNEELNLAWLSEAERMGQTEPKSVGAAFLATQLNPVFQEMERRRTSSIRNKPSTRATPPEPLPIPSVSEDSIRRPNDETDTPSTDQQRAYEMALAEQAARDEKALKDVSRQADQQVEKLREAQRLRDQEHERLIREAN